MHAICVTSWVFQAGEGSAANLEGTVETACHICCGHREWIINRREPTAGSLGITAYSLSSLHKGCQALSLKMWRTKEILLIYVGDSQKTYSHLGVNSKSTEDRTPYIAKNLRHSLHSFSLARAYLPLFFSIELGWTATEIPKSFLKIVGMIVNTQTILLYHIHTQSTCCH